MSAAGRVRGVLGRVVLDALAVGGLLCILLVIASFVLKVSIMMFATGSMAPTIPAGSIAFVREVPATEIAVGDVVTVDRGAELPITHRVTEVVGVDGDVVTFTMQGDANEQPDVLPYEATTVRVVLWSVPGLADVVMRLQSPLVLGGVTLGATVLVVWAFWPRRELEDPDVAEGGDGELGDDDEAAAVRPEEPVGRAGGR